MKITSVRTIITPAIAAEMLGQNNKNRPIGRIHAARLAGSMTRGEWDFNGTTIKIASSGRLLDGQHRLTACIQSQVSFETLVVYGLDEECFASIDQATRGRTISDVLATDTGKGMKNVAAALFVLWQLSEYGEFTGSNPRVSAEFSATTAREMLLRHPGIIASVAAAQTAKLWRTAYCSCLHYVFGMVDSALADDFVCVLREGSSDLRRPFNLFREGLVRVGRLSATADPRDAAARAIKAFNAEMSERPVSLLTWRKGEAFPVIVGLDYDSIRGDEHHPDGGCD